MRRKRLQASLIVLVIMMVVSFNVHTVFGNTLDDVLNNQTETQDQSQGSGETTSKRKNNPNYEKNKSFIEGLQQAGDVSAEVEGVSTVTAGLKTVVAFIVQVISYGVTIALALRVAIDLAFIALPFARGFLGNGYVGNAQAGAGGMPGTMNQGMMGGGMMGGGMGGYNRYNRGGMMGGGMMGGGMGMPGAQQGMGMGGGPDQQPSATGRVQWVSNAALNAIAGENTVGPDGKSVNPFKLYIKDMVVIFIMVPILLTLAVTGALSSLGFLLAQFIVDGIASIGSMI